mgnify:CR=1 FL=1
MRQITIASGKGGTGKTTISVNLAAFLATQNTQVVLADADVEEPNSALFSKPDWNETIQATKPTPVWNRDSCTLCGDCMRHCHFNAIMALPSEILVFPKLCHSCFACSELCPEFALPMQDTPIGEIKIGSSLGVTCVEGRLDVGQEMATPLIAKTIQRASQENKEWLIVDAPPGTSCSFIESIKESQKVILVTEPTAFGLHDLKAAVESVRALKKPFGVVLNRVGMGDERVEEYCARENIPIIAKIAHDENIAKTYANGEMVFQSVDHFRLALEQIRDFMGAQA